MPFDDSGVYTRLDNTFSNPVAGTPISPTDADTYFDDIDAALNAYYGTSVTSLAVGTGTKTFVTQEDKLFGVGRYVIAVSDADQANFMWGRVTGYTDTSLEVDVLAIGGTGTHADWTIYISGGPGQTGATGATGAPAGVKFNYSTTTSDADPGPGNFRFNNAAIASVSAAYIDNNDADGNSVTSWLDTLDDSTTTHKGYLLVRGVETQTAWAIFSVTGSVVDGTGYRKLTLTYLASGGTFSNGAAFAFNFLRTGDKGSSGAGTGDMLAANNLSDVANVATAFGNIKQAATDSATGVVELATPTEVKTGTDTTRAVTPEGSAAAIAEATGEYLYGMMLSTAGSSSTFAVSAGSRRDSTNVANLVLASSLSKTTSAWAVGSTNGALDTGTIANNTWYHVYAIKRLDTGVTDILISLSASSPTMPTNYTVKRYLGAMLTNGSGQWVKFYQYGKLFLWEVPVTDRNTTAAISVALYTVSVPTGRQVRPIFGGQINSGASDTYLSLGSASYGNISHTFLYCVAGSFILVPSYHPIWVTNTSAQIYLAQTFTGGSGGNVVLRTSGWIDDAL